MMIRVLLPGANKRYRACVRIRFARPGDGQRAGDLCDAVIGDVDKPRSRDRGRWLIPRAKLQHR